MNTYNVLSKIYRQIAEKRQHFQRQYRVIQLLFEENHVAKNAKILDAACGKGGTVQHVKYYFSPRSSGAAEMSETVSYHMYHWRDAVDLLENAGFAKTNQKVYEIGEWPYLVTTAGRMGDFS